MVEPELTRFERLQQRYRARDLPWDDVLPPPEVRTLAERLPVGRVLDLGCGSARASIYLAARGWQADAVDFVPEAIALAGERVAAAGQQARVRLHLASVTALPMLRESYDLAIDVGCLHGLEPAERVGYAAEVARLVRPAGCLLLFAHTGRRDGETTLTGLAEPAILALLGAAFSAEQIERGETHVAGQHWSSAWFQLRRR
jgi:SAM-dependent methyltransferase